MLRRADNAAFVKQFNLLRANAVNVERFARHKVFESLNRLRGTDQSACTTPAHIRLAFIINLTDGRRPAFWADFRHLEWVSTARSVRVKNSQDLRDDVPCPLNFHLVSNPHIETLYLFLIV